MVSGHRTTVICAVYEILGVSCLIAFLLAEITAFTFKRWTPAIACYCIIDQGTIDLLRFFFLQWPVDQNALLYASDLCYEMAKAVAAKDLRIDRIARSTPRGFPPMLSSKGVAFTIFVPYRLADFIFYLQLACMKPNMSGTD